MKHIPICLFVILLRICIPLRIRIHNPYEIAKFGKCNKICVYYLTKICSKAKVALANCQSQGLDGMAARILTKSCLTAIFVGCEGQFQDVRCHSGMRGAIRLCTSPALGDRKILISFVLWSRRRKMPRFRRMRGAILSYPCDAYESH